MGFEKEILLLFVCACFNGIFFNFGFFYSYNVSYVKLFHPEYPIYLIYTVIIPMDLGLMCMNLVFPKVVRSIGIKNCFFGYALSILLEMVVFVFAPNLLGLYLAYFLLGFAHQFMVMNILYILNVKFPDRLVKFTGYVFSGTAVSLMWGFVFTYIVNPANEEKSVEFLLPTGDKDFTFSETVSLRFPSLCAVYGLSNIIVPCVISNYLDFPRILKPGSESSQRSFFKDREKSLRSMSVFSSRALAGLPIDLAKSIGTIFC